MLRNALHAFLMLWPLLSALQTVEAAGPNVLLITVDDMNWDSVGVFGCPVEGVTPNIDRLAREGMRFEQAHVTIAICQPTRAVWMTGRYPHRSGALGFDPINKGVPTLLEAVHEAGYLTGIMAKVPHVLPTRKEAWDVVVTGQQLRNGRDPQRYLEHAREFFARVKETGQPFFLMANSQDPHRPFAGSAQEAGRREGRNRRRSADFPQVRRVYQPEEVVVPEFLPDIPDVREEMAEYFTSVHRADEIVGAVLEALEEAGHAEDTLVMFLSDHGMPLPFAKTNCYYNSTRTPWIVRWPGVVQPGSVDGEHMISGIDLTPTVLDALGLDPLDRQGRLVPDASEEPTNAATSQRAQNKPPVAEGMDGRTFLPLLKGQPQEGRDYVITHINRTAGRNEYPMRSVITPRFAYIFNGWADGNTRFKNESQNGLTMKAMIAAAKDNPEIATRVQLFLYRTPEEFYNYETDPAALHNLIDDPTLQPEITRLRRLLHQHMIETNDPQLATFQLQTQKLGVPVEPVP